PTPLAASSFRNCKIEKRHCTRIIELLVPLCFRSSCQDVRRCITNFGSGALAAPHQEARMSARIRSTLTRRRILTGASATLVSALGGVAKPHISRAADRPLITHGLQSGDVSTDSGVVWARADRPSRMLIEVATTDSFKQVRHAVFVDALPETDL